MDHVEFMPIQITTQYLMAFCNRHPLATIHAHLRGSELKFVIYPSDDNGNPKTIEDGYLFSMLACEGDEQ